MTNYKILRVFPPLLCCLTFCSILVLCEAGGILLALYERDWTYIVGGAFFGVLLGLLGGLFTFTFLFLLNLFAPITNGVSVQIAAPDTPSVLTASNRQM